MRIQSYSKYHPWSLLCKQNIMWYVCKNVTFWKLMLTYILWKGGFSAFNTASWLMELIVRLVINIFCLNADLLIAHTYQPLASVFCDKNDTWVVRRWWWNKYFLWYQGKRSMGSKAKSWNMLRHFDPNELARGRGTAFWAPNSPRVDAVAGRSGRGGGQGEGEVRGVSKFPSKNLTPKMRTQH